MLYIYLNQYTTHPVGKMKLLLEGNNIFANTFVVDTRIYNSLFYLSAIFLLILPPALLHIIQTVEEDEPPLSRTPKGGGFFCIISPPKQRGIYLPENLDEKEIFHFLKIERK